jgi:hypothetical protein
VPKGADGPDVEVGVSEANFERLRAASFGRLIFLYPGAGPFWSLVAGALVLSVSDQARRLWGARRRMRSP